LAPRLALPLGLATITRRRLRTAQNSGETATTGEKPMNLYVRIGAALAIAASAATDASAQFKKYGAEAGWEILIKENMGPGCLMARKANETSQVQMGIDATGEKKGYFALYTMKDAKIKSGQKLSVIFDIDGQQFSGEAVGQQIEGYDGAFVWVNNPDFIYDLAKKKKMTISPAGRDTLITNLEGTDAAFKALRACQDAQ
jgi:hypothetical protein